MIFFAIERLQERVKSVVSKAYSNIKTEEFAKLLGINEQQAVEGNFILLDILYDIFRPTAFYKIS